MTQIWRIGRRGTREGCARSVVVQGTKEITKCKELLVPLLSASLSAWSNNRNNAFLLVCLSLVEAFHVVDEEYDMSEVFVFNIFMIAYLYKKSRSVGKKLIEHKIAIRTHRHNAMHKATLHHWNNINIVTNIWRENVFHYKCAQELELPVISVPKPVIPEQCFW